MKDSVTLSNIPSKDKVFSLLPNISRHSQDSGDFSEYWNPEIQIISSWPRTIKNYIVTPSRHPVAPTEDEANQLVYGESVFGDLRPVSFLSGDSFLMDDSDRQLESSSLPLISMDLDQSFALSIKENIPHPLTKYAHPQAAWDFERLFSARRNFDESGCVEIPMEEFTKCTSSDTSLHDLLRTRAAKRLDIIKSHLNNVLDA